MTRTEVVASAARDDITAALRVSVMSAGWTLCSSVVAVAIGVHSHTAVLVALGAIGFVDAIGSVTLAVHFRDALHNETLSERLEALSHAVVLVCLAIVGAAALVTGVARLVRGDSGGESVAGVVLAAVSAVVLGVLARRKSAVAPRVASDALRSDGHLSGIGGAQAVVALAGTAATSWLSWTAADSVATAVVGAVAFVLATVTWLRHE